MNNDKLREAQEALKRISANETLGQHYSNGCLCDDVAVIREALAASKPEPQAQAAEHEVWRFGFVGAAFVFMKDGPYVLLEQIKKHHREDIAKRDAALDACAEALKYAQFYSNKQHVIEKMNAAITKAQEARKS